MLWIMLAVASLVVVAVAAYRPQFRRLAEPILSVLVTIGLISAFVVWWNDDNARPPEPVSPVTANRPMAAIAEREIRLEGLSFASGNPAGSYTVTGTIHNDGAAFLDYFTLDVALQDCPAGTCRTIGGDDALVLARIPPGQSAPLRISLFVQEPRTGPPAAPRWTTTIVKIRSLPAGS